MDALDLENKIHKWKKERKKEMMIYNILKLRQHIKIDWRRFLLGILYWPKTQKG